MRCMANALVGLLAVAALGSCGGGDGDSGGPDSFPTTAASLDAASAASFATFVSLAARIGASTRVGPFPDAVAGPNTTLQQSGCLSGSTTLVLSPSIENSAIGNATYANFDNCYFLALNGVAAAAGTLFGTGQIGNLALTSNDLAYTRAGTGDVFRFAGDIVMAWKLSVAGHFIILDGSVSDGGGVLFRLDNFVIDSNLAAGVENVLLSGRLTTAQGFVDISTGSRLELPIPSTGLGNGAIVLTGLSQIATVTYSSGGAFTTVIAPKP